MVQHILSKVLSQFKLLLSSYKMRTTFYPHGKLIAGLWLHFPFAEVVVPTLCWAVASAGEPAVVHWVIMLHWYVSVSPCTSTINKDKQTFRLICLINQPRKPGILPQMMVWNCCCFVQLLEICWPSPHLGCLTFPLSSGWSRSYWSSPSHWWGAFCCAEEKWEKRTHDEGSSLAFWDGPLDAGKGSGWETVPETSHNGSFLRAVPSALC